MDLAGGHFGGNVWISLFHVDAFIGDNLLNDSTRGRQFLRENFTAAAGADEEEALAGRAARERIGQRFGAELVRDEVGAEAVAGQLGGCTRADSGDFYSAQSAQIMLQ